MTYWQEELHPRAGKGNPQGGWFVAKGGSEKAKTTAPERKQRQQIRKTVIKVQNALKDTTLSNVSEVATEAVWHLLGGESSGFMPMLVDHDKKPHWFLQSNEGIIDPSASLFSSKAPYDDAEQQQFDPEPSAQAQKVLDNVEEGKKPTQDLQFKPLKGVKDGTHPATISPLVITAKPRSEEEKAKLQNSDTTYLPNSIEAMKVDKDQFKANVTLLKNKKFYSLRRDQVKGSADDIADAVRDQIESNLEFIYNNATPEELKAKDWYRGANDIAQRKADEHNLPLQSVVGVIARLSPQQDWDQNIYLADRVVDIYMTKQDTAWDKDMDKRAKELSSNKTDSGASSKSNAVFKAIRGKKLGELTNKMEQAAWIRVYDEVHGERILRSVNVDGSLGDIRKKKSGEPVQAAWGVTLDAIANGLICLDSNGDRQTISDAMGDVGTKIRSFYNNILDPEADNGDTTIDTHAIGAAWMLPMSGRAVAYLHAAGRTPKGGDKEKLDPSFQATAKSTYTGITGLYGLYADAYRNVAKRLGLKASELQAVVWTVKRNTLMAASKTNPDAMNQQQVNEVHGMWDRYAAGKQSLAVTQKAVMSFARQLKKNKSKQ